MLFRSAVNFPPIEASPLVDKVPELKISHAICPAVSTIIAPKSLKTFRDFMLRFEVFSNFSCFPFNLLSNVSPLMVRVPPIDTSPVVVNVFSDEFPITSKVPLLLIKLVP